MIEQWWLEAGRNQVEPLMNGTERLAAVAPPASRPHEYEHRAGDGPVVTASPFVAGFELAADIELPEARTVSGIVCAQGDWHVGWACYLLDSQVVVALNLDGTPERLTTDPLPPGSHTLRVMYAPGAAAGDDGTAFVAVDDQEPSVERVPDRLSAQARMVFAAKLLVGRDRGFPVCDDYQPPFPFAGILHRLTLRLPMGKSHAVRDRLAAALRHD
jgi:arylsulfatase